jgi:hypothetical protein
VAARRCPKEWTHRYSTFVRAELHTNFVLLVSDGKELRHDTLYHLGIAVVGTAAVVRAYELAQAAGMTVQKPPRRCTSCGSKTRTETSEPRVFVLPSMNGPPVFGP